MSKILCEPVVAEERQSERTATMLRPVVFQASGIFGFCMVRNLSEGGMMGQVFSPLDEGSDITLFLSDDFRVAGQVRWSDGVQIGVEFDESLDVSRTLAKIGRTQVGKHSARAPRLPLELGGDIYIGHRRVDFILQNISQRGLRVRAPLHSIGEKVDVSLSNFGTRKALVCWIRDGSVGLNFLTPIPFRELASWAVNQQTAPRDDCQLSAVLL